MLVFIYSMSMFWILFGIQDLPTDIKSYNGEYLGRIDLYLYKLGKEDMIIVFFRADQNISTPVWMDFRSKNFYRGILDMK